MAQVPEYPDRDPERSTNQRLDSIEDALWGPPRKPNGLVGSSKDHGSRLRRLEVGVAVIAVATVSPKIGGPAAPQLINAVVGLFT